MQHNALLLPVPLLHTSIHRCDHMHVFGWHNKSHTYCDFSICHISVTSTFSASSTTKQSKSASIANLTKSFVPMSDNTYYCAPLMWECNGCFEQADCRMAICCSEPLHRKCQESSNKSHHSWLISILGWPGPSSGSKCANSFSLSYKKSTHYFNAELPLISQHHNYMVVIHNQTQLWALMQSLRDRTL